MATHIITEQEAQKRNAIAYLKGQIIGYAVRKGIKWESTREQTKFFQAGFDRAQLSYLDERWVTARHIIHNRLRHNKPHLANREAEEAYNLWSVIDDVQSATGYECLEAV